MPNAAMLQMFPDALVSEVFITDQLSKRSVEASDYRSEKLAIQDLASRMLDSPNEVLPRFVELAMEMLGGCSAGLSLYERDPSPGVFRWQHLCGTLARFAGATTPRNYSPCGITLDRAAPVLARHAEQAYTWISDAGIVVPEVLLVPLFIGGSEPLGTLWIVSDVEEYFTSEHARIASELATFVGIALHVARSEDRLRHALEAQEMLTREMSHRVKNLFAVTDGMIRQSLRGSETKEAMAKALSGRLAALATAHSLVLRDACVTIEAIDLKQLVEAVVRPHDFGPARDKYRIAIGGPSLTCSERIACSIALVFNELATNAVKYGSLGCPNGAVDITWTIQGEMVLFLWTERGGPSVEVPRRSGFGSKLVEVTVTRQLEGKLTCDWHSDGLVVSVALPMRLFRTD